MKIKHLGLNTFEDTDTKTKFVLYGFEGPIELKEAEGHIKRFVEQETEKLLVRHFYGKKDAYQVLVSPKS